MEFYEILYLIAGSIRFVCGGPKSFLMKIHALHRLKLKRGSPATRKRVSPRDGLASRNAAIGTAVRYPAQPGGVEEAGPGADSRTAAT